MDDTNAGNGSNKYGTVAFITTPQFREVNRDKVITFVCEQMYFLCTWFDVVSTGSTYDCIQTDLLDMDFSNLKAIGRLNDIKTLNGEGISSQDEFDAWKKVLRDGIRRVRKSFPGMIQIIYDLVEGRVNAVIHLTDSQDMSAKPDSAVLTREANVHNVPMALNIPTAEAFIDTWSKDISKKASGIFAERQDIIKLNIGPLEEGESILAMVSHDNKKLEMCCFAVQHVDQILSKYKYIIATGTTGTWLQRFISGIRGSEEAARVIPCLSGPLGGDLQIANEVVKGRCRKIIFFQDPSVSHPHDPDIRLFEQAVVSEGVSVQLATNAESAKLII